MDKLILKSERCHIVIPQLAHAPLLLAYYQNNQAHLAPWEPLRQGCFYTQDYWQTQIENINAAFEAGTEYRFIALNSAQDKVIGICNFTNVSRGIFQACNLGYSIDEEHQGQGLMFELLTVAIDYMFAQQGLHRIMANYIPTNKASEALLLKLGFEKEGYAKSYLKIAGQWQDHCLTAKLNLN